MSMDMTLQKWAIFIMGVYGDISCKFQLEIRSNKKVIAKKPLTNLYEINSKVKSYFTLRIKPSGNGEADKDKLGQTGIYKMTQAFINTGTATVHHN